MAKVYISNGEAWIDVCGCKVMKEDGSWATIKNGDKIRKANNTWEIVDCVEYIYSRTEDFQRNNCSSGNVGSIIPFTKQYKSFVSLEDAQDKAYNDENYEIEGQEYVNLNATCTPQIQPDVTGIIVIDINNIVNADICAYVATSGVTPYNQVAHTGKNFIPLGTVAGNCWLLASDLMSGSTRWRFEFNLARLLLTYPEKSSFRFIVRGRALSATTISGSFNKKGPAAGKMTMTGSSGSYIPSTENSSNLGIVTFSDIDIPSGANGTFGIAIGDILLDLTYTVSTKELDYT